MPVQALFVLDALETFNPDADSTFVMITEALARGHEPWGALLPELSLHGDAAHARVRRLAVRDDGRAIVWADAPTSRPLAAFDVVLMRKDPPVDENYLTATWLLDRAGTLVVNAPGGLRELNEKIAIARFAKWTPKTFISSRSGELREILRELGGTMIVKPVYGYGGREILLLREDDPNLGSLLELVTADGTRFTVAQQYLPAAREGDKRILLIDGEAIGAVLRVPAAGELRNNFHAGGQPALTALSDRDRAICSDVGPVLRELGQFFVGIDVIGGHLTEINVTSPTGMQEVNRLENRTTSATTQAIFWDALESKLGESAGS
jgi:glutathione synthase